MWYVYILSCQNDPNKHYTGYTENLKNRLADHNSGKVPHTSKFKPWILKTYIAFSEEQKARDFETYLKSGSGRVFSKKRF